MDVPVCVCVSLCLCVHACVRVCMERERGIHGLFSQVGVNCFFSILIVSHLNVCSSCYQSKTFLVLIMCCQGICSLGLYFPPLALNVTDFGFRP